MLCEAQMPKSAALDVLVNDNVDEESGAPATDPGTFAFDGHVKWFDATRGFGFVICDQVDGDILVHFSLLKPHSRRSLPEGAGVRGVATRQERGLQAIEIADIDLSSALPVPERSANSGVVRADRQLLVDAAGEYESVEVKWFNRVKGYGFLNRVDGNRSEHDAVADIFLHMETVRQAEIADLEPGQMIEARIAEGRKGLTAVEIRLAD